MLSNVIHPRSIKLVGDMDVNRILPFRERRMVGPFIFLDEMNARIPEDDPTGGDVPPHPHIGLSTLTYLFEGEVMHRDSTGVVQRILPGEVNWMTAGHGVTHSERIPPEVRLNAETMHGMQAWIALPLEDEECEPSFQHYSEVPSLEVGRAKVKLVAGSAYGATSPVKTSSKLFYLVAEIPAGETLRFEPERTQCGIYLIRGAVTTEGQRYEHPILLAFDDADEVSITAESDTLCLILGGEPLEGERHIFWNFVSSSRERIELAKQAWREYPNAQFGQVPDDDGYVPLPGEHRDVEKTTMP
jgi:redox-sensitive bicupin YhaK (pirin superfamily)